MAPGRGLCARAVSWPHVGVERTELLRVRLHRQDLGDAGAQPLEQPRFVEQARLRLAWLLAVGRSSWWIMYFVYMPIQVKASGSPPL